MCQKSTAPELEQPHRRVAGELAAVIIGLFPFEQLVDPDDPTTEIFYYAGLAPYHKTEPSRKYWAKADQ